MESSIELKEVIKTYRDFQLGPLNLTIKKGLLTAIIGRNGAGKTTMLKGMAGIEPISAGEIKFPNIESCQIKSKLAYVSDHIQMYSDFTCSEAIRFVASFYPSWDKDFEISLVKLFKIPLDKKIYELSKGMKVKLNLLLSLAFHPEILLLDEPTEGLDPIVRKQFIELILDFIEEEQTVCISTHIITDIEAIADYLIFLKDGRVALHGEKEFFQEDLRFVSFPVDFQVNRELFLGFEETKMSLHGIMRKDDASQFAVGKITLPTVEQLLEYVVEGGEK